jgi:omega-6 fatty acid desaturase (delta-12 desaturase)
MVKYRAANIENIPEGAIWRKVVSRYNKPDRVKSILTLADSVLPFLLLWYLMFRLLSVHIWISLALSIPAAGFMIRTFIVFHDCGHGSFFSSRRVCNIVGALLGVIVLTPFYKWTREHAIHHSTVGDVDRRGTGDVWLLTKTEYLQAARWKRILYRVYRSPFFLFTLGAFTLFLVLHRFHGDFKETRERAIARRELVSVYGTDLALAAVVTCLALLIGIRPFLLIQLPILFFGAAAGVWLFYIQHQFDGVYWCRTPQWDYATVALKGASFYKLPPVLQWFTGNIGFHHVHHLSPRIPSYMLPLCHRENAMFRVSTVVTLRSGPRCASLRLWDERVRAVTGFAGHHWYRGPRQTNRRENTPRV